MPTPSPVLDGLREHIQPLHRTVDSMNLFGRLLDADVSYAQCDETMGVFVRWITRLSQALEHAAIPQSHPLHEALAKRREWLEIEDAAGAIGETPSLPAEANSPAFWDGLLYVLEGSAMGGMRIAKHLNETLDPLPKGVRYFETHGKGTMAHWQSVAQYLDAQLQSPSAREDAYKGASYGFQSLLDGVS